MLIMLLIFEATVVKSRMKNLSTLRETVDRSRAPRDISVLRYGKWGKVSSEGIVPGDIISIIPMQCFPCDAIILSGSCVANESLLTGESTPHLKESLPSQENETSERNPPLLCPDAEHKGHVIFAGTEVMQVTNPQGQSRCIAFVIRTGFETSQGNLMRTILFASERVTANNRESFAFIAILLVFALGASGYVLHRGLQDLNRSRWKLFLNCSLILTSVVPPELPMELSLAVNSSLLALKKLGVFCTEPFFAFHLLVLWMFVLLIKQELSQVMIFIFLELFLIIEANFYHQNKINFLIKPWFALQDAIL